MFNKYISSLFIVFLTLNININKIKSNELFYNHFYHNNFSDLPKFLNNIKVRALRLVESL